MILAPVIVGYVLIGVGTARTIAARMRRFMGDGSVARAEMWNFGDPEITFPTVVGGVLWPLAWVWLLLLGPIFTVIGPLFAAWWLKPYRRAGGEL